MKRILLLTASLASSFSCLASVEFEPQLWLNAGWGKQSNAGQNNGTWGADLLLWEYHRSAKQSLSLGVSYTHLVTDRDNNSRMEAFSIVPQYNLYAESWRNTTPFFFLRAIGPSYISQTQLGSREQANHFAFQAQVGAGLILGHEKPWRVSLSYKHFSNGYLFSPNDGIDVPLLLTVGKTL